MKTICAACGSEFPLPGAPAIGLDQGNAAGPTRPVRPADPSQITPAGEPLPAAGSDGAAADAALEGTLSFGAAALIGIGGLILAALVTIVVYRALQASAPSKEQAQSVDRVLVPRSGGPQTRPINPLPPISAPARPAVSSAVADHGTSPPPAANNQPRPANPQATANARPAVRAVSGRPPVHPVADADDQLTDEQIGQAIQRGVDFLIGQFDSKAFELRDGLIVGPKKPGRRNGVHDGIDVICVYALMQCGEAINDTRLNIRGPFMVGCIEAMKSYPLEDRFGTYTRGLRATALALNNRKEDQKALKNDVLALLKVSHHGAFGYYDTSLIAGANARWDNSNSQYGLLGVWAGAEADPPVEVPTSFWVDVEKHWTGCQASDGEWGYEGRDGGKLTMTCAGLASMFVCHDLLDAPKFGSAVGREPFSLSLRKGLQWLEQGNHSVAINQSEWWGYALYGVERVGLASGLKFFGTHNWYPELAREVLRRQGPDGSWGGSEDPVNTAYALLFLSRGRHPILMNKLRFDGAWANRPRDVANLAKYATVQLERPINWQVVPLKVDWTQWTDTPILYLASHEPPTLSDADVDNIRQYVLAGGMLFMQADGDAPAMAVFAAQLSHRLFPMYEITDVPPGHPLFSSVYRLQTPPPPPLKMVSNGSRILVLFSPTDISRHWQLREQRTAAGKAIFQLGINMFVYATGRRDLRNRLETNVVAPVAGEPVMTVKIARVQYAGAWDPEPYAWTRFARWFRKRTGYALEVVPVSMGSLDAKTYPFAHLTGAVGYNVTASEAAAVKKYVEAGGVLLIDVTGGTGAFDQTMRLSLMSAAFPGNDSIIVRASHPLLRAGPSGMEDLSHIRFRPYTLEKLGSGNDSLELFKAGKGHILFTRLDLTSGLLNTSTWGIIGYEPGYAQNLLKNAIFWALDGQKEE